MNMGNAMPIAIVAYERSSHSQIGRPVGAPPPPPPVSNNPNYRFSGYHLVRNTDGSILRDYGTAMMNQPAVWSRRAISGAMWDLRSP